METKNPPTVTSSYHHQRAPRTPESYFNVPESVALLNIVKSERIQSAFQSNRKNHASVWEMVAEVLNRFSARKRTAKQCCNRYENLKKIYTQLKKNPERHVRRNWPYMFLFKEIEEQRGECWGSNGKRLALMNKNELSYYQRRRQAAELGVLLNKDNLTPHQHNLLQSLSHAHSTDSSQSGASKMERGFMPNHFVETQLSEGPCPTAPLPVGVANVYDDNPLASAVAAAAAVVAAQLRNEPQMQHQQQHQHQHQNQHQHQHQQQHQQQQQQHQQSQQQPPQQPNGQEHDQAQHSLSHSHNHNHNHSHSHSHSHNHSAAFKDHGHGLHDHEPPEEPDFDKDCNGPLNLHHNSSAANDNNISMKSEPLSEGEFNPDDIQLMQTNYNGAQNFYSPSIDQNILHPDVIVDTDNLSDCTSSASLKSGKRKLSTSTDGDSTNYELIEYLKRREKRDEELLKRMDSREERFMNLLERTVIAIEQLAAGKVAVAQQVQATVATKSTETEPELGSSDTGVVIEPATIVAPSPREAEKRADSPAATVTIDAAEDSDSETESVMVLPDESSEPASTSGAVASSDDVVIVASSEQT